MKGFKSVIGAGTAHSRFLFLKTCPTGCGFRSCLTATQLRELVRPDEWPQPDKPCEDVWRCTEHFVVNVANRWIGKVDFGIGRSLHQCVPLSVRACQAMVSMLSSECYLTQLHPEQEREGSALVGEGRAPLV